MDFLVELDAETLKAELLAFLECDDIDIESKEDFKEQFVDFIKEDFSYGDEKWQKEYIMKQVAMKMIM